MESDIHRPQLWKEGSGIDGLPAGPRSPLPQHFREKRETNQFRHGLMGKMMAEMRLCSPQALGLSQATRAAPPPAVIPIHTHTSSHLKPGTVEKERSHQQTATGISASWNALSFRQEQPESFLVVPRM